MSSPIIEIHGLGKRYRIGGTKGKYLSLRAEIAKWFSPAVWRARAAEQELWALKDVSFSVQEGESIGIIGRNGAGKSTLLKVLSQITPPTRGRITMRGRVASLLEVGTGFHDELTGRENVYLNGAILGMTRREIARKFDEIVAFAEMERFLDTPVKHYSRGMEVRLAFAVAAHLEPEILIVDEVLAVGDAEFQKKCMMKMGSVAREGRTVLFVSHNMIAIQTLCQRAIWLNAGQLKEQGAVNQIVAAYIRSIQVEADLSERVWADIASAPGNQTVRLRRIALQPEDGMPGGVISMQTPVQIEVDYWNLLPGVQLMASLHIFNDQGVHCFTTRAGNPDSVLHLQPPAGLYRSICHIPGNLLNSGFHRVLLVLERRNKYETFRMDDAIGFEVVDNLRRKTAWFWKDQGALCPALPWETNYLGNNDLVENRSDTASTNRQVQP